MLAFNDGAISMKRARVTAGKVAAADAVVRVAQRVAGEDRVTDEVAHAGRRVPRRLEHAHRERAEVNRFPFAHQAIEPHARRDAEAPLHLDHAVTDEHLATHAHLPPLRARQVVRVHVRFEHGVNPHAPQLDERPPRLERRRRRRAGRAVEVEHRVDEHRVVTFDDEVRERAGGVVTSRDDLHRHFPKGHQLARFCAGGALSFLPCTSLQRQRCDGGTPASAASMWRPQPPQVVFRHFGHVVR